MSQEFSQPPMQNGANDPNPNVRPTPNPPKKSNSAIYIVIIALLAIGCIYLFVTRNTIVNENVTKTNQLATSDSARKIVENDYNAALGRLDELTSKNAQMDSMINSKDGDIARLKSQISSILSDSRASASQLAKAKELIGTLNSKVKSYEERIAELEGENNQLTTANTTLTKQRDSTATQASNLKQLGSVLHASNIRMVPIHVRHNGKERETDKARKVDAFLITFDIDENRIAESGTKPLYLRVLGPDGTLLSNAAYGSGSTAVSDGSQMRYTVMKEIALEQNQPVKDVQINWHQDNDYKRGTYTIEIYNSGYKIGGGSVTLH